MKGTRVDNVRIKDLMVVLANLHLDYEAVDIIVYPEEKRVVINPVGEIDHEDDKESNKIELEDKDLDII